MRRHRFKRITPRFARVAIRKVLRRCVAIVGIALLSSNLMAQEGTPLIERARSLPKPPSRVRSQRIPGPDAASEKAPQAPSTTPVTGALKQSHPSAYSLPNVPLLQRVDTSSKSARVANAIQQPRGLPVFLVRRQESIPATPVASDDDDLLVPPQPIKPPKNPVENSGAASSPYDEVFNLPPPIRQPASPSPSPSTAQDEDLLVPSPIQQPIQSEKVESGTRSDLIEGRSKEPIAPRANTLDEDLLPPIRQPQANRLQDEIESPSDRPSQSQRLPPTMSDLMGEVDEATDFESERDRVTPYQRPSLDSSSERVVPLPVIPAPDDFRGFGTPEPEEEAIPEPKRRFELPKPEHIPAPEPMNPDGQSHPFAPSDPQSMQGNLTMPWHNVEMYEEIGSTPLIGSSPAMRSRGFPDATNRLVENRPTLSPIGTLPERLHSRHYQFQVSRDLPFADSPLPLMSESACMVEYQGTDFAPNPQVPQPLNPCREIETYFGKSLVETQRPWVEWWRPFYTGGMYKPGIEVFSDVNLLTPTFLVYGDYRTGVGIHRFGGKPVRQWAHRLNLDMDLRLTGTERFHLFTGPLDHNGRFTRLDFSDSSNVEFEEELDFQPDTAFFEGDLGAITGSMMGVDAPFDLPFTMGIVPLLYQNGIWMEDAIVGMAVGTPWRNSRALNWSNFETTFFAGFANINSPAFQDENAARVYGTAWFVEAYNGYIEMDYAYLDERQNLGQSYHNAAVAYTRRYFGRISNSVRLIGNAGQRGNAIDRTADGGLLLIENSLISSQPSTFVPYFNFFLGNGRPQSVARAGGSGGILRNTGINFESDGLTAYPTLNATGANSYGGAVGINMLSGDFRQSFVCEFTALDRYGNPAISGIQGPQYAVGARYQRAINNRSIMRFDVINGWLDNAQDIYGLRSEFRWKF